MKDIIIILVTLTLLFFAFWYSYQIWKRKIEPTLSTWIIFLLGTGLSLITYVIAENADFRSGILNTIDVVVVLLVLISILIWGNHTIRFKKFEKWYLSGVCIIVVYGILTGDAWRSNIFTQILIAIGYFPTIQNLTVEKKSTESVSSWSISLTAGILGLYPAIIDGNTLAIVYSVRTIVLVSILIIFVKIKNRK